METSYQEKMALFRYEVIRPLLNGEVTLAEERRTKDEILQKDWKYPDGSSGPVKARTLRNWLGKYRKHGLDGLFYANKQPVVTKGSCRAIPNDLLKVAREMREEDPRRSVEQILDIMQFGNGLDVSCICPRTLMRYFKRLGLRRGKRFKGKGQHERYEQVATNHLWHGDTAHTFMLADPEHPGQVKKAKLVLLIDDASRVCPHGEFYFDEKLPSVMDWHLLDRSTLEDLRLFSNSKMDRHSMVSIILLGQIWLRDRLKYREYEALNQRLRLRYSLEGLSETETGQYIEHHLRLVGCSKELFTTDAVKQVFIASGGIPRPINNLCVAGLLKAMLTKKKTVDGSLVKRVAKEQEVT